MKIPGRLAGLAAIMMASMIVLSGCAPEPEPPIPDTVFVYPPITGEWDGTETIWRIPYVFDLDSPSSLTVIVNKLRPLADKAYVPANLMMPQGITNVNGTPLRAEAATALEKMAADAKAAGIELVLNSGYRSYATQISVYNGYVQNFGQAAADSTSARPGFSEHQTGLAADLSAASQGCAILPCFETTSGGQWLAANAWKYGFVLRYPNHLEGTTGYNFEPWHYRYVGLDLAKLMHDTGYPTLENYLGLDPAPDYK